MSPLLAEVSGALGGIYLLSCIVTLAALVMMIHLFFLMRWGDPGRGTGFVGFLLRLGVLTFPQLFAWVTLLPGFRGAARVVAFGWAFVWTLPVIIGLVMGQEARDQLVQATIARSCASSSPLTGDQCACIAQGVSASTTPGELAEFVAALRDGGKSAPPDTAAARAFTRCGVVTTVAGAVPPPPAPDLSKLTSFVPGDDARESSGSDRTVVRATTSPPGARLWLDGVAVDGVSPFEVSVAPLVPHLVTASLEGHLPETTQVPLLSPGEAITVGLQVSPATAAELTGCRARATRALAALKAKLKTLDRSLARCKDRFACLELEERRDALRRERDTRALEQELCGHRGAPAP